MSDAEARESASFRADLEQLQTDLLAHCHGTASPSSTPDLLELGRRLNAAEQRARSLAVAANGLVAVPEPAATQVDASEPEFKEQPTQSAAVSYGSLSGDERRDARILGMAVNAVDLHNSHFRDRGSYSEVQLESARQSGIHRFVQDARPWGVDAAYMRNLAARLNDDHADLKAFLGDAADAFDAPQF